VNGEGLTELQAASACWEEFAAGEDCPGYLATRIRIAEESIDVPLPGERDTIKPGRVVREVILRRGSQEGPVVLHEEVPSLVQAVRNLTRGVQEGVGLGMDPTWEWKAWLFGMSQNPRRPPDASYGGSSG
jgi:hypothetical protein